MTTEMQHACTCPSRLASELAWLQSEQPATKKSRAAIDGRSLCLRARPSQHLCCKHQNNWHWSAEGKLDRIVLKQAHDVLQFKKALDAALRIKAWRCPSWLNDAFLHYGQNLMLTEPVVQHCICTETALSAENLSLYRHAALLAMRRLAGLASRWGHWLVSANQAWCTELL